MLVNEGPMSCRLRSHMSTTLGKTLTASLLGAAFGVIGSLMGGEPIASLRFWFFPIFGGLVAFASAAGVLFFSRQSPTTIPIQMPPEDAGDSSVDDSTPRMPANPTPTVEELTHRLARKVSTVAVLRGRLAPRSVESAPLSGSYRALHADTPLVH